MLITAEQLLRSPWLGRCELIDGKVVPLIPPGSQHGWLSVEIAVALRNHTKGKGLGVVHGESGFVLKRDPDTVRAPDVSFTLTERATPQSPKYSEGAPDLVVEVLSPDDRAGAVADKVALWLETGATLVWVIDPRRREAEVHRLGHAIRTLTRDDTLTGEPLLPDFALPLRELFP